MFERRSNNALTMNSWHGASIMGRSGLAVLEKMVKGDSKLVSASVTNHQYSRVGHF